MGWGAVVGDNDGKFLLACQEGIEGILSPELAEASAIWHALMVARDNGFTNIFLILNFSR
jgi:hypothetical protein